TEAKYHAPEGRQASRLYVDLVSKKADAEGESPNIFPKPLVFPAGFDATEHSIDVKSVVENEGANRSRDAKPGSGGIAQVERLDTASFGPEVACIDEQCRLHVRAERNSQFAARIHEHVAATDDDLRQGERRA